jgi:hypothetical protein
MSGSPARTRSPSCADLGENGRGERIPFDERLAGFDVLSVVNLQRRTVDE